MNLLEFAEVEEDTGVIKEILEEFGEECVFDPYCLAELTRRALYSGLSLPAKRRLLKQTYRVWHPLPPPWNQQFLNHLLKNHGVSSIGSLRNFLRFVDEPRPAYENLKLILSSRSSRKDELALMILSGAPQLADKLAKEEPEVAVRLMKKVLRSGRDFGELLRKAVPIIYSIERNDAFLKSFLKLKLRNRREEEIFIGFLKACRECGDLAFVRRAFDKTIERVGKVRIRRLAYIYGAEVFGEEYRKRALKDRAKSIRKWAAGEKPRRWSPEEYIKRGMWYLEQGRADSALKCAETACEKGAGDRALILKAQALYALGDFARAEALLDGLIQKQNHDAYVTKALLLLSSGRLEEALRTAREGVERYPESFDLRMCLAQLLYFQGDEEYMRILEELHREYPWRTASFMLTSWMETPPLEVIRERFAAFNTALFGGEDELSEEVIEWFRDMGMREQSQALKAIKLWMEGRDEEAEQLIRSIPERFEFLPLHLAFHLRRGNAQKALQVLDAIEAERLSEALPEEIREMLKKLRSFLESSTSP